jgi:hypothetical protein
MHGVYNCRPETNHFSKLNTSVVADLGLQFMTQGCFIIIIIIIIVVVDNNFEAHNVRKLGVLNTALKFRVAAMFVVVDL